MYIIYSFICTVYHCILIRKKKEKLQSAVGFEPRTYSQVTSEKKKKKPRVVFGPAATKKKKKKKATSGV